MTALFDGMAGVLNSTFGASVTYLPASGGTLTVHSVFRETPIEIAGDAGGTVLIEAPTWRVPVSLLASASRGDRIQLGDGRIFKVLNGIKTGSPAADHFRLYEMELVP
jgi:hypothetical protein